MNMPLFGVSEVAKDALALVCTQPCTGPCVSALQQWLGISLPQHVCFFALLILLDPGQVSAAFSSTPEDNAMSKHELHQCALLFS